MTNDITQLDDEIRTKYAKGIAKTEEQNKNEGELKEEIKKELFGSFGGIIGVFGSFSYVYSGDVVSEDIIDYIATQLCKKNKDFIVITGRAHYIYDAVTRKVVRERPLQDTLQQFVEQNHINWIHYSTILASVCNYATFIVAPAIRSTSLIEETEFCKNIFKHNILGVFVYFVENQDEEDHLECGCYQLDKFDIDDTGQKFYLCKKNLKGEKDAVNCINNGTLHKINYASLKTLIDTVFTYLVITKRWENVPDIFQGIKSSLLETG